MDVLRLLKRQHIQSHGEANTTTQKYWGYPERILPCTKDVGTCEYLEAVTAGEMYDAVLLVQFCSKSLKTNWKGRM